MLDVYGVDDPAERTRLARLAREGRRPGSGSGDGVLTLREARQAPAAYLTQTADTHLGTAKSVLLRRLAECRCVVVDLLAASAAPGRVPVQVPLLRFMATWSIRRERGAWVAEQRSGSTALRTRIGAQIRSAGWENQYVSEPRSSRLADRFASHAGLGARLRRRGFLPGRGHRHGLPGALLIASYAACGPGPDGLDGIATGQG